MLRKRMLSKKVLLALLVVAWVLAACSPGSTPTASPTPTPTIPAEPTSIGEPGSTPTPPPVRAPGWEDITVRTLCLKVEQSYPQIEGEFSQPIAQTAEQMLMWLGLQILAEEASCDAKLVFSLTGEALGAAYTGGLYCYSGARVSGEATLVVAGRDPLALAVAGGQLPPGGIGRCPEEPTDAPFERAWPEAVLDGLAQLWGLPALTQALTHGDPEVREEAAYALRQMGPDAVEAIPVLIGALGDEESGVRDRAASALANIGPEAVPALIQALGHDYFQVRSGVAIALGRMGQDAVEAVPSLIRTLTDEAENSLVRSSAARALGQIGAEQGVIAALMEVLGDEDANVRMAAVEGLGYIGREAVEAVPALIEALKDQNEYVRRRAALALEAITGQDFGEDADAWQEWWESQQ